MDLLSTRISRRSMRLFEIWVYLLLINCSVNTSTACPSICRCGKTNGRVSINCERKNLRIFPTNISRDMQLLRFRGNSITSLPQNFAKILPDTTTVGMENNRIEYLQDELFSNLKQLQEVFLSRNRIRTIGKRLFANAAPGAKVMFRMENNLVERISEGVFQNSTSIFELHWSQNNIKTILPGVFKGAEGVHYANLEHNRIEKLTPGLFKDLNKLYYLGLANNNLSAIESGTFTGLHRVETLTLQKNKISTVSADAFKDLSVIKEINLQSNLLTEPPVEAIRALPSFTKVKLKNNPIICTCKLRTLLSDLAIRNKIIDLDATTCSNLNKTVKEAITAVTCVTEASPTTTPKITTRKLIKLSSQRKPNNLQGVTSSTPTSFSGNTVVTKKFPQEEDYENQTPLPLIIGASIGAFIIIVVIILFVYLYRRPIARRASTMSLPRKKPKEKGAFYKRSPFNDYSTDYNI